MISGINKDDTRLMELLFSGPRGISAAANSNDANSISGGQNEENDFLTCLNANFNKLDTNADNNLSQEEIQSFIKKNEDYMGPPPGMFIDRMDYSGVEKIEQTAQTQDVDSDSIKTDASGFKAKMEDFISKMDTNKDGQITSDEISAAIDKTLEAAPGGKTNAFSEMWNRVSDSDLSHKLLDQFSKKLSEVYNSASSANALSSVADVIT